MTTAVTSGVIGNDTLAHFQAWVGEVITALFTTLGVTQTSDTGQTTAGTIALPVSANQSMGYVIGRFNDTLQATKPIFFKLEFGSGGSAAQPCMWITLGTGSNGTGSLNAFWQNFTTGAVTGTGFIAGHTMTQTTSGATATVAQSTTVSPVSLITSTITGTPDGTHVWTDSNGTTATASQTPQNMVGYNLTNRVSIMPSGSPLSTATSYSSYWCYNATLGFLGFAFKNGGSISGAFYGGVTIGRSTDMTGAATGDGAYVVSNAFNATPTANSGGCIACISFNLSGAKNVFPDVTSGTAAEGNAWGMLPLGAVTTTYSSNVSVAPGFCQWPFFAFNTHMAIGIVGEIATGSTYSLAMIGSGALTYIALNGLFGATGVAGVNSNIGGPPTTCMLWQ
jgi:hypothetical protein